jgi:hypothetical protein
VQYGLKNINTQKVIHITGVGSPQKTTIEVDTFFPVPLAKPNLPNSNWMACQITASPASHSPSHRSLHPGQCYLLWIIFFFPLLALITDRGGAHHAC